MGWSFAHPLLWPLQIIALAWLAFRIHPQSKAPWRGLVDAALFGLAMYLAGLWWLPFSLARQWPEKSAASAVLVLVVLGLLRGLAVLAFRALLVGSRPGIFRVVAQPLAFAASWAAIDLVYGVFIHAPMLSLGYGQVDGPFAGFAPLGGVQGVSFVTALAAWLLCEMVRWAIVTRESWPASGYASALLFLASAGILLSFVRWTGVSESPMEVAAIQSGLTRQDLDDDPAQGRAAQALVDWSHLYPEALLVGSETEVSDRWIAPLSRALDSTGGTALVGVRLPTKGGDGEWNNSVLALGRSGDGYRYDKITLIPFGEYTPNNLWGKVLGLALNYAGHSTLVPGAMSQANFVFKGHDVIPTICFESYFPWRAADRLTPSSARVVVNLADMAIFAGTPGMAQDIAVNRMLALSLQTPLVSGTDDGPTMMIDSSGTVITKGRGASSQILVAKVAPSVGLTPYVRMVRWFGRPSRRTP